MASEPLCLAHAGLVQQLTDIEKDVGQAQQRMNNHCNEGSRHVTRTEVDEMKSDLKNIKSMLAKATLAIALISGTFAAGGAALGKPVWQFILSALGGK